MLREASRGDPEEARKRLALVEPFAVLGITEEAERLADIYAERIPLLRSAAPDALHLAIASVAGMDYLATWNCTQIARGEIKRVLENVNDDEGIGTPTICTPQELLGV